MRLILVLFLASERNENMPGWPVHAQVEKVSLMTVVISCTVVDFRLSDSIGHDREASQTDG